MVSSKSEKIYAAEPASYQEYFSLFGYVCIPQFLSQETATLMAEELSLHHEVVVYQNGARPHDPFTGNAYGKYGLFDAALRLYQARISEICQAELYPVNSYARLYFSGSTLAPHVDKPHLQVNATICLSRDSVSWPFCVRDSQGGVVAIAQNVGDAVWYRGEIEHWREGAYAGSKQAQLFLHYCLANGPRSLEYKFDGRKGLGLKSEATATPIWRACQRLVGLFRGRN